MNYFLFWNLYFQHLKQALRFESKENCNFPEEICKQAMKYQSFLPSECKASYDYLITSPCIPVHSLRQ